MQRTQYYTPDGELWPIWAIDRDWYVIKFTEAERNSQSGFINNLSWEITIRDGTYNSRWMPNVRGMFCDVSYNFVVRDFEYDDSYRMLYASDFTEEELKDLVDEKDL